MRAWVIRSADGAGEARITGTVRWVATGRLRVLEPTMDDPSVDPRTLWQAICGREGRRSPRSRHRRWSSSIRQ